MTDTAIQPLRVLVVHSAASHSGKTTLCRALVRDLPFDAYIKLSRHSRLLEVSAVSSERLCTATGDTSRILECPRAPGLPPLRDVLLCDGPRVETDRSVMSALARWDPATRVLVEGNCSIAPIRSLRLLMLACPLPPTCKPNIAALAAGSGLLVLNRLPVCSAADERTLTEHAHDWSPHATLLSGSLTDAPFVLTIEERILCLIPSLRSP